MTAITAKQTAAEILDMRRTSDVKHNTSSHPRSPIKIPIKYPVFCTVALIMLSSLFVALSSTVSLSIFFSSTSHKEQLSFDPPHSRSSRSNSEQRKATVSEPDKGLLKWISIQRSNNDESTSSSISQLLTPPLYFPPGTLPISQLDSLQHCYADPAIYSQHFHESSRRRLPFSKKHNLALILIPKSGSSTGRYMMTNNFHAIEKFITLAPPLNVIAFVREPLSRFFSQFEEAFTRTAPWVRKRNPYASNHPFPFLYDNLHIYNDYQDIFCPPAIHGTHRPHRECKFHPTQENGTLSSRMERFVQEYSGLDPFDIHLKFQVPFLSNTDGYPIYITQLYNTSNSKEDWKSIASQFLGSTNNMKVIEGRSYARRINDTMISNKTRRRICALALIDYCCLNFPLPNACQSNYGDDNSNSGSDQNELLCKMDYDEKFDSFRIQPGFSLLETKAYISTSKK